MTTTTLFCNVFPHPSSVDGSPNHEKSHNFRRGLKPPSPPSPYVNIDYKLQAIPDKNFNTYFHDLHYNPYAKLFYHFKLKYQFHSRTFAHLGFI